MLVRVTTQTTFWLETVGRNNEKTYYYEMRYNTQDLQRNREERKYIAGKIR